MFFSPEFHLAESLAEIAVGSCGFLLLFEKVDVSLSGFLLASVLCLLGSAVSFIKAPLEVCGLLGLLFGVSVCHVLTELV